VNLVSGPNRFLLERLKGRDLDVVVGRLPSPEQMTGWRSSSSTPSGWPWSSGRATRCCSAAPRPAPSTSGASPATPS
jgi:hypothetical protein